MRELKSGKEHVAEGHGRTVDADLEFMSKALRALHKEPAPVVRSTRMSEIRSNTFYAFAWVVALYFGWCVFDRFYGTLPSDVSVPHITSELPVPLGGKVRVRFDLVRYRVCQRNFTWILQDHLGNRRIYTEPPIDAIGNPGPDSFSKDLGIPTDLDPGKGAKLRISWSWSCPQNLLEAVYPATLVLKDLRFEIAPKPAS